MCVAYILHLNSTFNNQKVLRKFRVNLKICVQWYIIMGFMTYSNYANKNHLVSLPQWQEGELAFPVGLGLTSV